MKKVLFITLVSMISFRSLASTNTSIYNILDFGAIPDTTILSTKAIQSAIDSCSKSGGGRVLVPTGNFLMGTILLKNNVELHLMYGAALFGSKNLADYTEIKPNYVALRTKEKTRQLIYAEDQYNIAITGSGLIDGQGAVFEKADYSDEGVGRPHLLQFINCKRVRILNISMRNSGAWMQHYLACEDLKIRGIEVFNHANYNNDGLDIDGCENVTISDVTIDSDDDGICLKSTSGKACKNVVITNCVVSSHCNGLKMGTESSGGFMNIAISNCIVKPSAVDDSKFYGKIKGISGVSAEMVDGGILKGVTISNIQIEGTTSPIFIRLGNRARPYSDTQGKIEVGSLSDVSLSNIRITNTSNLGSSITGIPGYPVKNISLSGISIEAAGAGSKEDFEREIPELEKSYPEATMFGKLPAYGFFIRHAENIELNNIQLKTKEPDLRPALYLEDVKKSSFSSLIFNGSEEGVPAVFTENSSLVHFKGCLDRGVTDGKMLKEVSSKGIHWQE